MKEGKTHSIQVRDSYLVNCNGMSFIGYGYAAVMEHHGERAHACAIRNTKHRKVIDQIGDQDHLLNARGYDTALNQAVIELTKRYPDAEVFRGLYG